MLVGETRCAERTRRQAANPRKATEKGKSYTTMTADQNPSPQEHGLLRSSNGTGLSYNVGGIVVSRG